MRILTFSLITLKITLSLPVYNYKIGGARIVRVTEKIGFLTHFYSLYIWKHLCQIMIKFQECITRFNISSSSLLCLWNSKYALILCLQEKICFYPIFLAKKLDKRSMRLPEMFLTIESLNVWRSCNELIDIVQYRYILCVSLSVSQYIKYKVCWLNCLIGAIFSCHARC